MIAAFSVHTNPLSSNTCKCWATAVTVIPRDSANAAPFSPSALLPANPSDHLLGPNRLAEDRMNQLCLVAMVQIRAIPAQNDDASAPKFAN